MFDLSRVDLTQVAAGGMSLIMAVWVVFQILKRQYKALKQWMPLLIICTVLILVVSLLWAPVVFMVIAATFIFSALAFGIHATGSKVTQKPPQ